MAYKSLFGQTLIIKNRWDQIIYNSGSYNKGIPCPSLLPGECAIFEMQITCMIEAGQYTFCAVLGQEGPEPLANRGAIVDKTPWLGPLVIEWDYESRKAPFIGMFGLPSRGRFMPLGA